MRIAWLVLAATLVTACGPICNRGALCAVTNGNDPKQEEVCDGDDFRRCEDKNRGMIIACENKALEAVCTPDGWSFQPGTPK
jgi:hypothetical protein